MWTILSNLRFTVLIISLPVFCCKQWFMKDIVRLLLSKCWWFLGHSAFHKDYYYIYKCFIYALIVPIIPPGNQVLSFLFSVQIMDCIIIYLYLFKKAYPVYQFCISLSVWQISVSAMKSKRNLFVILVRLYKAIVLKIYRNGMLVSL